MQQCNLPLGTTGRNCTRDVGHAGGCAGEAPPGSPVSAPATKPKGMLCSQRVVLSKFVETYCMRERGHEGQCK